MSNNYRNTPRRKRSARKVWKVLGMAVAVLALLAVVVGLFGNSFSNPFEKDINPNNLIKVDKNYIRSQNTNHGVEIDVSDNGTIKLSGEATSDYNVKLATVELAKGTYTLSGLDEPNMDECFMYLNYGSSGRAISGTESATFTIDETMTVTIVLTWMEGCKFNIFNYYKIQPVLVKGEAAGSFYAD